MLHIQQVIGCSEIESITHLFKEFRSKAAACIGLIRAESFID